jgi:predicted ATP-grasp superfamily ATP-dependent carboligase
MTKIRHSSLSAGPRVLVDADDFYGVLAGVRGLRRAGYRPWVLTPVRTSYAALSSATEGRVSVPSPASDAGGFVTAALNALDRLGGESILPGTESGLVALAGRAPAVPSEEIVARALDKDALAQVARDVGLATPPTFLVAPGDAVDVAFPAIVKPVRTKTPDDAGKLLHGRAEVVHDAAELERAATSLPGDRVLVQPLLRGALGAVSGVAWRGEFVCAVHQRSLRISPPLTGVSAMARTVPADTDLERAVARLLAAFEWSGIFQLQVVWDGGVPHAIDFNPRIYGSLALAVAAGANLPAIWADLVAGREPHVVPYRVGVTYRSEEKEAQSLVLAVRRGDWRTALDVIRPRPGSAHAAFAWDDPLPLLGVARRLLR